MRNRIQPRYPDLRAAIHPRTGAVSLKQTALLVLPILLLAACRDMPQPLAPEGDAALSSSGGSHVDLIVVLDRNRAPGEGQSRRARAAEIAQGFGLTPRHTYGTVLMGFAATVPASQVRALRAHPMVAHVEFDRPVSLPEPVLEPRFGQAVGGGGAETASTSQVVPWGIHRTGALANGLTGSGVSVYVLDTGIDPDHPDLRANLGEGHTVFECKGNPHRCPGWTDDHWHGTHVAGTIGALDNGIGVVGVAPQVTLHAVKVLDANANGAWSGIVAGIDWVAGHNTDRPRIANMSLSGSAVKSGTCTPNGLEGSNDFVHTALCNARNAGVVIVSSAGNTGGDAAERIPAAYYDAVMAISATLCKFDDQNPIQTCTSGSEGFASFSSWGQDSDGEWPSEGSLPVAIAAPGSAVLSTDLGGGYRYASGTSMAAPHVAGAAALVLQELGGAQAPDETAFTTVRQWLMGASECTETWHNIGDNPHSERFLNARGPDPINECVATEPAPAAPTNLRVIETTTTTVQLAWDHETDAPAEITFEIWQYTSSWTHLTFVTGTTSYTVEGLSPNTSYRYVVRAVSEQVDSDWSNILDVATPPEDGDDGDVLVAAFVYDCGNSGTCSFADESLGQIEAWHWNMGNGQTSVVQNPAPVTYTSAGLFTVSLTVTDVFGRTEQAQKQITCGVRGNRLRCR